MKNSPRCDLREALKRIPFLQPAVRHLRRRHQIRAADRAWNEYSAAHKVRALNIGCSSHILPEWFNVDCFAAYPNQYFLDAAAPFPYPDNSFDVIRSEHMIEHVPYLSAMHMLRECHRILRPGGFVRIATPDLKKLARLYDAPLSDEQKCYADSIFRTWRSDYRSSEIGVVINNIFLFENHFFIYDSGTLGEAFRKAGFVNVVESRPGVSEHALFRETDLHAGPGDDITFETLTMEAQKA